MDVHFFLSERTNFIRYFFEEAVKPVGADSKLSHRAD